MSFMLCHTSQSCDSSASHAAAGPNVSSSRGDSFGPPPHETAAEMVHLPAWHSMLVETHDFHPFLCCLNSYISRSTSGLIYSDDKEAAPQRSVPCIRAMHIPGELSRVTDIVSRGVLAKRPGASIPD